MPLRCETPDGVTIQTTDCDDAQWEALRKRNRERRDLIMPCCNADTVLKKSPRGTRFFAHKPSRTRSAATGNPRLKSIATSRRWHSTQHAMPDGRHTPKSPAQHPTEKSGRQTSSPAKARTPWRSKSSGPDKRTTKR